MSAIHILILHVYYNTCINIIYSQLRDIVITNTVHEGKVHPPVENSGREVNPLGKVGKSWWLKLSTQYVSRHFEKCIIVLLVQYNMYM